MSRFPSKCSKSFITAIFLSLVCGLVIVYANTDAKHAIVYIRGVQTAIEENGTASDYRDGSHGLCSWTNNNIGSAQPSYRVLDPSSCWTVCQNTGFEIQRINLGKRQTTNWYQSVSALPTYRHVLCMSRNGYINRVVYGNARHFIYHDGGVFDNWTFANHIVSCTSCNP